jgi:DNA-binding transcriptional LysR family regulator
MTTHPVGNLDVRLMRTLLILLTECSVSKTADILGQAQPTISLTLKRLRDIFDDPLLARSGNSLLPTERGMDLRVALEEILGRIDTHLAPRTSFNPAISTRGFPLCGLQACDFVPHLHGLGPQFTTIA